MRGPVRRRGLGNLDLGCDTRRRSRISDPAEQGVRQAHRLKPGTAHQAFDLRVLATGGGDEDRQRPRAGIQVRRKQVRAFEQSTPFRSAHPAVERQRAPPAHARVVARAQRAHAPSASRTGANERR